MVTFHGALVAGGRDLNSGYMHKLGVEVEHVFTYKGESMDLLRSHPGMCTRYPLEVCGVYLPDLLPGIADTVVRDIGVYGQWGTLTLEGPACTGKTTAAWLVNGQPERSRGGEGVMGVLMDYTENMGREYCGLSGRYLWETKYSRANQHGAVSYAGYIDAITARVYELERAAGGAFIMDRGPSSALVYACVFDEQGALREPLDACKLLVEQLRPVYTLWGKRPTVVLMDSPDVLADRMRKRGMTSSHEWLLRYAQTQIACFWVVAMACGWMVIELDKGGARSRGDGMYFEQLEIQAFLGSFVGLSGYVNVLLPPEIHQTILTKAGIKVIQDVLTFKRDTRRIQLKPMFDFDDHVAAWEIPHWVKLRTRDVQTHVFAACRDSGPRDHVFWFDKPSTQLYYQHKVNGIVVSR